MSNVINIQTATFGDEVMNSEIPVLVDFWASWCAPCRAMAPIVDQIAEEYDGKIKVGKVNVDDEGLLAAQYGIMSIPTLILFKNGESVDTIVGLRSKEQIAAIIDAQL